MRNPVLPLLMLTTALAGCSLAPDFKLPDMKLPEAYKEAAPSAGQSHLPEHERGRWKKAEDLEAADKGEWWKTFGNPELNQLMQQAMEGNASLQAAASRVEQSRATAEANTFSFLPNLDLVGNAVRAKPSDASLAAFGNRGIKLKPYNLYSARGVLSYEADLFGRVRDGYRAFLFDAAASQADFQNVLLTLQADVASNYFSIRALDSELALLRDTVDIRDKAHNIMKHKYDAGAAGEQDLTRTMSELASTKAELASLERERKVLEHALAVLLGKMPSDFTLAAAPLMGVPPEVPAGLPSTLLERRPDIARAIAQMQAANTRIGVARTAFFPVISLTASGGYEATEMGELFNWSSRAWALGQQGGAALAMPIFDSGRNLSRLDSAWASYEESVGNYRQQVLVAFRDVEDNLTGQNLLAAQSRQQDDAAAAASRTTEVVQTRYDEGAVEFFEVVNVQRDSLAATRASVRVRGQRFLTSIALVRALGGGWNVPLAAAMPPETQALAPAEGKPETPQPEAAQAEEANEAAKPAEKVPEPKKEVKAKKPAKKTSSKSKPAARKPASKAKSKGKPARKAEPAPPPPIPQPKRIAPDELYLKDAPEAAPEPSLSPAQSRRGPSFGTELNKN